MTTEAEKLQKEAGTIASRRVEITITCPWCEEEWEDEQEEEDSHRCECSIWEKGEDEQWREVGAIQDTDGKEIPDILLKGVD